MPESFFIPDLLVVFHCLELLLESLTCQPSNWLSSHQDLMVCLKDFCCIYIFSDLNGVGPPIGGTVSTISGQWSETGLGWPFRWTLTTIGWSSNQSIVTKTVYLLHEAFSLKFDHAWHMFSRGRSIRLGPRSQIMEALSLAIGSWLPFLSHGNRILWSHRTLTTVHQLDWPEFNPKFWFAWMNWWYVQGNHRWLPSFFFFFPNFTEREKAYFIAFISNISFFHPNIMPPADPSAGLEIRSWFLLPQKEERHFLVT